MDPFDLRKWGEFHRSGGDSNTPAIVDQIVIDSRRIDSPKALFVALKGKHEDGHSYVKNAALAGAKYALVARDWQPPADISNITLIHVDDPLQALQEIAKSYRLQLPIKLIGITGSFGKTMVKDLAYLFLKKEKKLDEHKN